jgi:type VI secretion system secreted protein Hcp
MAVDMFMKLEGLEGEARDSKHKNEIDVLAWSWGMSNSGSAHVGGGAGAGKVNVQDLSFTKWTDKATADMQLACCNGKHFTKATLTVRKAGESPVEYLIIEMEEVMITSISAGGSGGEDRLTENVTLNFAKVGVNYQEQDEKGKPKGGPKTMTWNIAENTK